MPRPPRYPYYGPAEGDASLEEAIAAIKLLLEPAHSHYCDVLDAAAIPIPLPAPLVTLVRGYALEFCFFEFSRIVLRFPRSVVAWRDIACWVNRECRVVPYQPAELGLAYAVHSFQARPAFLI